MLLSILLSLIARRACSSALSAPLSARSRFAGVNKRAAAADSHVACIDGAYRAAAALSTAAGGIMGGRSL